MIYFILRGVFFLLLISLPLIHPAIIVAYDRFWGLSLFAMGTPGYGRRGCLPREKPQFTYPGGCFGRRSDHPEHGCTGIALDLRGLQSRAPAERWYFLREFWPDLVFVLPQKSLGRDIGAFLYGSPDFPPIGILPRGHGALGVPKPPPQSFFLFDNLFILGAVFGDHPMDWPG
jgi:hypothetical protein